MFLATAVARNTRSNQRSSGRRVAPGTPQIRAFRGIPRGSVDSLRGNDFATNPLDGLEDRRVARLNRMSETGPDKWQRRFLGLTDEISGWSKDPSRGVGAVIVSPSRQIVATGFNGLPRGLEDTPGRLQRPVKYDLTVHAELNAIIQCARNGVSPIGCTLYSSFSPCVQCAIAISQSGIKQVITYALDEDDERWVESIGKAVTVFEETGIEYLQFNRWTDSITT